MAEDNDMIENEAGLLSADNEKDIISPDTPSLPQNSSPLPLPPEVGIDQKLGSVRARIKGLASHPRIPEITRKAARVAASVGVAGMGIAGIGSAKAEAAVPPEAQREVASTPDLVRGGEKLSVQTTDTWPDQPPAKPNEHEPPEIPPPPTMDDGTLISDKENPYDPIKESELYKYWNLMTGRQKDQAIKVLTDLKVTFDPNSSWKDLRELAEKSRGEHIKNHQNEEKAQPTVIPERVLSPLEPILPPPYSPQPEPEVNIIRRIMRSGPLGALSVALSAIAGGLLLWYKKADIKNWVIEKTGGVIGIGNTIRKLGRLIFISPIYSLPAILYKLEKFRLAHGIERGQTPDELRQHPTNRYLEGLQKILSWRIISWAKEHRFEQEDRFVPDNEFYPQMTSGNEVWSWKRKYGNENGALGSVTLSNGEEVILGGGRPEREELEYGQKLLRRATILREKLEVLDGMRDGGRRKRFLNIKEQQKAENLVRMKQELDQIEISLNETDPVYEIDFLVKGQGASTGERFSGTFMKDLQDKTTELIKSRIFSGRARQDVFLRITNEMVYGISTFLKYDDAETKWGHYRGPLHNPEFLKKVYEDTSTWQLATINIFRHPEKGALRSGWLNIPGVFYLVKKMEFGTFPVERGSKTTKVPYNQLKGAEKEEADQQLTANLSEAFKERGYPIAELRADLAKEYAEWYFIITRQPAVIDKEDFPAPPPGEIEVEKAFQEWFDGMNKMAAEAGRQVVAR